MINSISVNINVIETESRFNPKYFHYLKIKNELLKKSDLKYVVLGNKKYFPILSDGIHSAVELIPKGEIKYLYIHNIKEGFIDTVDNLYISEADHEKNINKELKQNAVLLSVVGSLGNTALFSDYISARCSLPRNIAYIYCSENNILPAYLTCFFLSEFSKYQCIYSGGGNIQGLLSLTKLKKFIIPLPERSYQKIIGEKYEKAITYQKLFLQKIKQLVIEFENELDINKERLKRDLSFSVRSNDLKNGGIWTPNLHDPYPDKILDLISKNHELRSLHKLVTFAKGNEVGSDNYNDYLNKKPSYIPFVRTSDIFNYEVDSFPDFYISPDIKVGLNQDIKPGDLLVNNDGRIGYPAIVTREDDFVFQSHIKRLRARNPRIPTYYIFLCLLLPDIKLQFDKYTVIQSTIPTLSNRIKEIKIPILDKNRVDYYSNEIVKAYNLIEEKKRIIKEIKQDMNNLIKN